MDKLREKRHALFFWLEFFAGIGAALYLVLLVDLLFFNIRDHTGMAVVFVCCQLALIVYFFLLTAKIGKEGENFRLSYAILALADITCAVLMFGFNTINYYPGSAANPLQWNIANVGIIFLAYPLNILLILMFTGTAGTIWLRLRPIGFQAENM